MPQSKPYPHTDFSLPGWVTTPTTHRTCLDSLATAYSRKWNPCNLEHPWYETWGQILQALVADISTLAVAPQSYLWYYRHPKPGDHQIEPPAHDEDDWFESEGNTTLDSIVGLSVNARRNKYQLIDFAITRKVPEDRPIKNAPDDQFLVDPKVGYMGIPARDRRVRQESSKHAA